MTAFWKAAYNFIALPLLYAGLKLAGLFNEKIKKGIDDRARLFEELILNLTALDRRKKLVWFHSSSMGEFEQAKPLIQKFKSEYDVNIIVTFFSPSGYRNSRKYPYANIISYLPFDTEANAARFLDLVKPDIAVMMRYDIWPNFIWKLKEKDIPCFIVDATMRGNSSRKAPVIKSFHQSLYQNITGILTVSETDLTSFMDFNIKPERIKAVGDTRYDRVYEKSQAAKEKKLFKDNFFKGKTVVVLGSSWEADEDVVLPALIKIAEINPELMLIVTPHEPTIPHLERIENEFSGKLSAIRFSLLNNYKGERVIIIDSIGILLTLYYYADIAYVGGSFKQGIHNVLEPAVYGIPVIFGPKIENSQEARQLAEAGGGAVVRNKREAYRRFRELTSSETARKAMGAISYNFVNKNIGATHKILEEIGKYI